MCQAILVIRTPRSLVAENVYINQFHKKNVTTLFGFLSPQYVCYTPGRYDEALATSFDKEW